MGSYAIIHTQHGMCVCVCVCVCVIAIWLDDIGVDVIDGPIAVQNGTIPSRTENKYTMTCMTCKGITMDCDLPYKHQAQTSLTHYSWR